MSWTKSTDHWSRPLDCHDRISQFIGDPGKPGSSWAPVQLDFPNSNDNPEQTITHPRTAWKSLRICYATPTSPANSMRRESDTTPSRAPEHSNESAQDARKLSRHREEDADINRSAHSFGADSLVAVELQFWFADETRAELSVLDILANCSIRELGRQAASRSQNVPKAQEKLEDLPLVLSLWSLGYITSKRYKTQSCMIIPGIA
ncbi:hypothetical protein AbraIFM66951_010113 [Aspergillus brasiliensis]|uniref:Carrier domain-containing protein n=1 Tax=Aspergillus brasiliensis TaxID=319629 RepID=A0A9W5YRA3_9EURO|nr:hypothetical protein AbraCBS73388_007002 [Aspergillus brasiliensis]GKZ46940.1 hypothetical protein AbraIFM66951_010113 [Aspergillus brasiliensis]